MDLSQLQDAVASKSFETIAEICDELMLKIASRGLDFQQEWPYTIHLLGHIYVNDLNSARFLWKSIPIGVKESRPEVVAAWKIGQCLWNKDYAGVYAAIRGFEWNPETLGIVTAFGEIQEIWNHFTRICCIDWPQHSTFLSTINCWRTSIPTINKESYTKRNFQLLVSAYSTISVADAAQFLGMREDDAISYALQHEWTLDSASRMLAVSQPTIVMEQKLDASKLQRLTEYIFHLEH